MEATLEKERLALERKKQFDTKEKVLQLQKELELAMVLEQRASHAVEPPKLLEPPTKKGLFARVFSKV